MGDLWGAPSFASALRRALDAFATVKAHVAEPPPVVEEGPPLVVDCYWQDLGKRPAWDAVVGDGRYVAAIIKCTEGTTYRHVDWFALNWPRIKSAGRDRYGSSWFRGAYHFLRFDVPGAPQADYYVRTMRAAVWDGANDLLPIVDVELSPGNRGASKRQVVEVTHAFVERVRELTGRVCILYGNGAMRDLGIRDRMGCRWLWIPRYTSVLPRFVYERAGWSLQDVPLWQYAGDEGQVAFKKLPHGIARFGVTDTSVYLPGDGVAGFRRRLVEGLA